MLYFYFSFFRLNTFLYFSFSVDKSTDKLYPESLVTAFLSFKESEDSFSGIYHRVWTQKQPARIMLKPRGRSAFLRSNRVKEVVNTWW